jgi:hypothetical protein
VFGAGHTRTKHSDLCLAEAIKRFDGLRAEFEAFARHWDDVGRTVVLDTSAIMGLSSPDGQTSVRTVGWFALLDRPTDVALRLVVPLVVVDELDNFKDRGDNKSKPAARRASDNRPTRCIGATGDSSPGQA